MNVDPHELREMVKATFVEVLEERARIDADTHAAHHAVINEWVECSKRRREIVEKVVSQVLGWGLVAMVGGLGALVWRVFRDEVTR